MGYGTEYDYKSQENYHYNYDYLKKCNQLQLNTVATTPALQKSCEELGKNIQELWNWENIFSQCPRCCKLSKICNFNSCEDKNKNNFHYQYNCWQ